MPPLSPKLTPENRAATKQAVTYIRNEGGTRSQGVLEMTKELLALVNNFSIVSYYVPEEQAVLHFKLEAWLIFVGDPLLKSF